ncbi:MAG: hypothetical protein MO852_00665, partial [Candidatus Devosia euplotis]|nr:hypothetical protein [Candidatus Devosia euplotis]
SPITRIRPRPWPSCAGCSSNPEGNDPARTIASRGFPDRLRVTSRPAMARLAPEAKERAVKHSISIITIGVDDLDRAFAFYCALFDIADEQIGGRR